MKTKNKMLRLTDAQLSRILGEHDAGNLRIGGMYNWGFGYVKNAPQGCAAQVALNHSYGSFGAAVWELANKFDHNYHKDMSHEDLLKILTKD